MLKGQGFSIIYMKVNRLIPLRENNDMNWYDLLHPKREKKWTAKTNVKFITYVTSSFIWT